MIGYEGEYRERSQLGFSGVPFSEISILKRGRNVYTGYYTLI